MKWVVGDDTIVYFDFLQAMGGSLTDSIGGVELSLTTVRGMQPRPNATELLYSHWYICSQTFHNVTSTSRALNVGSVTSEPLTPLRNETTTADSADIGDPNYTRLVYRAESTGQEYSLIQRAPTQLFNYLGYMLSVGFSLHPGVNDENSQIVSGTTLGNNNLLTMGYFLNLTDLHQMTANVAATLSAQVQGQSPGDNKNLTMISGKAWVTETYIFVRWQWLILQLLETLVTVVLLVVTMIKTKEQPLVKNSTVASLLYGLEGWDPEKTWTGKMDAAEKLQHRSGQMVAWFGEGSDGRLCFSRAV